MVPGAFTGAASTELALFNGSEYRVFSNLTVPGSVAVLSGVQTRVSLGSGDVDRDGAAELIGVSRYATKNGKLRKSANLNWTVLFPETNKVRPLTSFGVPTDKPVFGCNYRGTTFPAVLSDSKGNKVIRYRLPGSRSKKSIKVGRNVKAAACTPGQDLTSRFMVLQNIGGGTAITGYRVNGERMWQIATPVRGSYLFTVPAYGNQTELIGVAAAEGNTVVAYLYDWSVKSWTGVSVTVPGPLQDVIGGAFDNAYPWFAVEAGNTIYIVPVSAKGAVPWKVDSIAVKAGDRFVGSAK